MSVFIFLLKKKTKKKKTEYCLQLVFVIGAYRIKFGLNYAVRVKVL